LVTAHEYPGKPGSRLDWAALARFPGTLVFYMGVSRLEAVVAALTDNGKDAATPAAVIERGTTARQRTVTAPLAGLADAARAAGVQAPALVVVGEVVELHDSLQWFERLPLAGRRVLITRPRHQAAEMGAAVVEQGGEPVYLPVVDVAPPEAWDEVDRHLAALPSYHWVVFTSANGVRSFLDRLRATGRDLRALGGARLAAIGPATADALRAYHLEPDLVPATYNSEGLVEALRGPVGGGRVLLARADRGLDLLRQELGKVAMVEQVAVYRQVDLSPGGEGLAQLSRGEIDLVSLTSTNIALGLARALDDAARGHVHSGRTKLVTISPRTSAAVREAGLPVAAEATEYTTAGVLAAMRRLVSERP
jgi:uroporphyrinogen III methyltransferase/synthase